MRTIIKFGFFFAVFLIFSGCSSDDDNLPDPTGENYLVSLRFDEHFSLPENEGPQEVFIHFDRPAKSQGEIKIKLHPQEGLIFQSTPEAIANIISLRVEKDDESVSFLIDPKDDKIIRGMKDLSISFYELSPGFRKANSDGLSISIIDDELQGKFKSYTTETIWTMENYLYEYRFDGKLSRIISRWPSDDILNEFFYNEDGSIAQLKGFQTSPFYDSTISDTYYLWENGKIKRSNYFINNILQSYSIYEYEGDQISKRIDYKAGDSDPAFISRFLYDEEGNLKQQINISLVPGAENFNSTVTYKYLDKDNPIPTNAIIPGMPIKNKLLDSWQIEKNGSITNFAYTYEFNADGKPVRRINRQEIITYEYY